MHLTLILCDNTRNTVSITDKYDSYKYNLMLEAEL